MSEIATGEIDYLLVSTTTDIVTHIIDCNECCDEQTNCTVHLCEETEKSIQLMTAIVKRLMELIEEKRCLKKVQQQECTVCLPESLVDLMNDMDI